MKSGVEKNKPNKLAGMLSHLDSDPNPFLLLFFFKI